MFSSAYHVYLRGFTLSKLVLVLLLKLLSQCKYFSENSRFVRGDGTMVTFVLDHCDYS